MSSPHSSNEGSALVTGASRGIGRIVALRLAALGSPVAVNYRAGREAAEQVAGEIVRSGGTAIAVQGDVSNFNEVRLLADQTASALGPISILVNNAGITRDRLLIQMSEQDWCATWATDVAGPRALSRLVAGSMRTRGTGRIINVGSVVGSAGNAGQANYAAAKSALMGLTRELAVELAPSGVTVNCVVPGYIVTDATAHLNEAQRERWLTRIPMGRYASPEEVADVIVFLTGASAGYVTGQCIAVDGGYLAAQGAGTSW